MAAWYSSKAFPTPPQSPPSLPLDPSLCSQQKPSPWDCSIIPKFQLITAAPSRGPASLSGGMYDWGKDGLILIPFRLPQISCFILSLKCFFSDSGNCPNVGIGPLLQSLDPLSRQGQVQFYKHSGFAPSSFSLLSFAWFYISFSSRQVLLTTLIWCPACTSVSEGVFLMYPWREMYSMSSYSSAILFSPIFFYKVNINITGQNKYYLNCFNMILGKKKYDSWGKF